LKYTFGHEVDCLSSGLKKAAGMKQDKDASQIEEMRYASEMPSATMHTSSQFTTDPTEDASERNLITRILSTMGSLSNNERLVANYIIQHQSAIAGLPQADLAHICGVSPSTISRFCKRIGEKDYHSFQLSLVQSIGLLHGSLHHETQPSVSDDDATTALNQLLQLRIADLTTTMDSLKKDSINEVVEAIIHAHTLEVAGTGRTIPMAMDAAYKFERAGIMSVTSEYYEKLISSAVLLGEGDVLLIISRSGWSGVLQQVLHAAKDHGATIVAITANKNSPIAFHSDYVLLANSNDSNLDSVSGNSRMAEMLVIEALYMLVCMNKEDSSSYMEMHKNYVMSNVDLP